MKRFILIACLLTVYLSVSLCQYDFRVMFYNVENLFDTIDDSLKNDDEFLPEGRMGWTPWKYWKKLRNITSVITAVGEWQSPGLVGLCEIENDTAAFHLTRRSPLRAQGYEYVITNSPDERGMNVALLYQRHQFRPLEREEYEITFSNKRIRPTRNILHVTGQLINTDTLDVFVCHFPSRSGGQRETEPARIAAATLLRRKTDSLFAVRSNPNLLVMGDFNDHPENRSLTRILGAKSIDDSISERELYNLFFRKGDWRTAPPGTYFYQGFWEVLDQLIVSGNMLSAGNRTRVKDNRAAIFAPDFLLEESRSTGIKHPMRTHQGPIYKGGFSDHLPVYLDLQIQLLED